MYSPSTFAKDEEMLANVRVNAERNVINSFVILFILFPLLIILIRLNYEMKLLTTEKIYPKFCVIAINKKSKKFKTRFSFYKDGFLVAGLSPKAIVFFGTIFTSFIDFNSNYYIQFLILIFTYVTLDFLTLMIYALAAEKIARWLRGNPKTLNTISACVLVVIAIFIAVTQTF